MKEILKQHNKEIEHWLQGPQDDHSFLEKHERMIAYLQHERLVHLLVLLFFALTTLILFLVVTFLPFSFYATILLIIFSVMTSFYVWHYYVLENTCQHWYTLYYK